MSAVLNSCDIIPGILSTSRKKERRTGLKNLTTETEDYIDRLNGTG
jgi:hypothetical protein